ncbi:MAG: nucleotidyltransferase domain-containing protein [Clostridiales bacterium]|nr:nucleotidyltransferase domain-containing protein [Clostridiales bacterium]
MCTQSQLHLITASVAKEAGALLGDKLDAVILYGSYARGDYDDESDIDIIVRIACEHKDLPKYRRVMTRCSSELSMQYGITVSVQLTDTESYDNFKNVLPFYKNIEKEGVLIA